MKWFWSWVSRNLDDSQHSNAKIASSNSIHGDSILRTDSVRFRVYQAAGGMIVEVNEERAQYDGYCAPSLYIIKEDDDFGAAIKRIITVEALKN